MKILDKFKRKKDSNSELPMSNSSATFSEFKNSLVKVRDDQEDELSDEVKQQIKGNVIRSVGVKLFITIFVGILACVIMMGQFALNKAEQIIEEQAIIAGESTIEQLGINIDNNLSNYEDLSLTILVDQEFHRELNTSTTSDDQIEQLAAIRSISAKLQSYLFSYEDIEGIALIPINDSLPTILVGSSQMATITQLKTEPWFQETIDMEGQLNWLDARAKAFSHDGYSPSFGVARVLKNIVNGSSDYVLLFDITTKNMHNLINRVGATEGGELSLISDTHHYIAHQDLNKTSELIPFPFEDSEENISRITEINGQDMLLLQTKLATNGWYLYETKPVEVLIEGAVVIKEMTVIVSFIAAGIAVIIAGFVVYNVSLPLVNLRNLMVQGAYGNLTIRSKTTRRKDEIGQLATSFNLMMNKISDLANQTRHSAEAVLGTAEVLTQSSQRTATSAREIAVATEEIANGATSLAGEAERGTDITLTINEQMKSVLAANEEMKGSAYQVEQASEEGSIYMNGLIQQTGKTEEMTRNMVEKVNTLQESTRSIVQILDMLNAVNKQTNILSLNATIEAARAGVSGKGFMVVANEIRTLADQSSQSIDVVGQITAKIEDEINQTVEALTEVYPLFQEQVKSVRNANDIFISVQSQMNAFIDKLEQVTQSVNHLESTQSILNESMTNVSAVAQESSATSEQVASLSHEQLNISDNLVSLSQQLNEMSQSLKDSISKFKIE